MGVTLGGSAHVCRSAHRTYSPASPAPTPPRQALFPSSTTTDADERGRRQGAPLCSKLGSRSGEQGTLMIWSAAALGEIHAGIWVDVVGITTTQQPDEHG